jgi:hypothetical protein
MHCDNDPLSEPIDSFSFVLDHTRGMMRYYPFLATNDGSNSNYVYDVPINPVIKFEGNSTGSFQQTFNSLNTINYFPFDNLYDNICEDHIPATTAANGVDYIRPAPFSLVQTFIGSGLADEAVGYLNHAKLPGIQHEYIVDRPIDLTIINPSEKTIYNPSDVSIDLALTGAGQTLIFPSGYTFKTVSGVYPTQTEVAAADPDHLYVHELDIPVPTTLTCDDAGPNDGWFANYTVKNGSILKIESCVSLYDVRIFKEAGGTVIFDNKSSVRGHYQVTGPGTEIDNALPPTAVCLFDCYDKNRYDDRTGNIHINSNQTWTAGSLPAGIDTDGDGIVRISGDLVIDANTTVTVVGAVRFEFGENGKLVIEPTGKLIVNGVSGNPAIFTSADFCNNSTWNGIEVRGNRALAQAGISTTPQGYIKLLNVLISNARNAIATRKESDGWNYNGGIIQCVNVRFLNNRRSAEFLSYHNTNNLGTEIRNLSYFKDCEFLVTDYLADKVYKFADGRRYGSVNQVSMWDVKNVKFDHCLFENSALQPDGVTALMNTDQRGAAIYAIDAGFVLTGGTSKNTFKGFSDGVWALSTGDNDYISIVGNVFENNINGIVLEGTTLSKINQNQFLVPAHTYNEYALAPAYNSGYNKPVGLYLIGATDFTAEENTFTNYGPSPLLGIPVNEYNYGMVVNNCTGDFGDGTGNVYKNTFSNLNVSLQAELNNKGSFSPGFSEAGLQYKCNEFTSRVSYDATVVGTYSLVGSLRNQGLCNFPENQAGNSYTSCSSGSEDQLKFDNASLFYATGDFHYRDQPGKISCTSDPALIFPSCPTIIGNNSCPSNISTCFTLPCLTSIYASKSAVALQSYTSLNAVLDGGSTNALITQINSNITAGALKNLLISKSPYLSDAVLLAMLNRTDMVPPGHLEQVSIANSPLTKPVMDAVERMPLPGGVLNNIRAAQVGISARSEKENEVSYTAMQAKLAEVKVKQAYLEIDNLDSLKIVALKDTSLAGLFKLLEVLIAKGDLSDAQICRSKIINKEMPAITDRCKLLSTRLNLALAGKSWLDMTNAQADLVQHLYESNTNTAINARAVLALTKGLKYERYPFDLNLSHKMLPAPVVEKEIIFDDKSLKIYPNPSTEYASVEANLPESTGQIQLVVYNLLGTQILTQPLSNKETFILDTKELSNGIYLFCLLTEQGIIEKQKVIISK